MRTLDADVLVIGGGLAGCLAAIRASDFASRVLLVDKGHPGRSGASPFVAGALTVCCPGDDADLWRDEIIRNGQFLSDQRWVQLFLEDGFARVTEMEQWAARQRVAIFERDDRGELVRKRSRGNVNTLTSVVRALPAMDALVSQLRHRGVERHERIMITDLVVSPQDGRAAGAIGFDVRTGDTCFFRSPCVVLAAGGCSFKSVFFGHRMLTGDLQAAAYRSGAVLQSLEFCSSNTVSKDYDTSGMSMFVAVGGKFVNGQGEEFMWAYNPRLGNRAERQEIVLAFCSEVREGRGPIYLDVTAASPDSRVLCRRVLPEIFKVFDRAGIDPFAQPLEWMPAFYGSLTTGGGLAIDLEARTRLPGLFAAGDATAPVIGGAGSINTAAMTSIVAGWRAGESAGQAWLQGGQGVAPRPREVREVARATVAPLTRVSGESPDAVIAEIRRTFLHYEVALIKRETRLREALQVIRSLQEERLPRLFARDTRELVRLHEARNMALIAELFLRASLYREESRGFHVREEHPRLDNSNWLKWVMVQREGETARLWTEDIPTPYLAPSPGFQALPGWGRLVHQEGEPVGTAS